jgi:uncharacterized protein YjbI with pentapeptide repeats
MQRANSAAGCTNPLHRCPQLTNTFTLTPSGQIILVLALGLAALTIIAWLAGWLPWKAHSHFTRLRDDLDHGWRDLSGLAMIIVIALVFLWLALFALTIMATFGGVLAFWGNPSTGGLGLGAILAGLLGAPFLIWTTVIKQTTLGFQKEGHITDRISKAVEQLGAEKTVKRQRVNEAGKRVYEKDNKEEPDFSKPVNEEVTVPNIEVRIGGILSLERIAQDSTRIDRGRDHVRVMEILCAYVRENAPAHNLTPTEPPFATKVPRIDIQKAIDVIKRRSSDQKSLEASIEYRLDLRAVDFHGADLSKGDFTGANFWRSRFEFANLEEANLTGAHMTGCLLNFAWWRNASLIGTSLDYCVLNRPEATAGGFNHRSPTMANVKGVSVMASDLSAMDYFGENPEGFFGTKDTIIHYMMDESRIEAANADREMQTAAYRNDSEKLANLEALLAQNPFKHWLRYDASDMAAGHLRSKWYAKLGLVGWPFNN